jgi:hypothetical protein
MTERKFITVDSVVKYPCGCVGVVNKGQRWITAPCETHKEFYPELFISPKKGEVMASTKIIYARGFPYGAPLCMIRGGGTKSANVREFLKAEGFRWGSRYAWEHYLGRREFGAILKTLRDDFGLEVVPKDGMDTSYLIDLDDPNFSRPEKVTGNAS